MGDNICSHLWELKFATNRKHQIKSLLNWGLSCTRLSKYQTRNALGAFTLKATRDIKVFYLGNFINVKYMVVVAQSCLTLWDPMDCSLPNFSVRGIFQAEKTGVGCHSLFQGIFPTWVSHTVGRFYTIWATREVPRSSKTTTNTITFMPTITILNVKINIVKDWKFYLSTLDQLREYSVKTGLSHSYSD